MSDHDRWLADYHTYNTEVWCENKDCENHLTPVEVLIEREYGQSAATPEECPLCHSGWQFEAPEEPE